MWEYNLDCVWEVFLEKIGTAMASPLRGIQGQSNIITYVEQRQKCSKLTQRGWCWMKWTTEQNKKSFKFSNRDILHLTLKPSSPLLINTNYIIQQRTDVPLIVDLYSMDIGLIFHWQLTLPVSAKCWPVYYGCQHVNQNVGRLTGRHIGWVSSDSRPILGQHIGG